MKQRVLAWRLAVGVAVVMAGCGGARSSGTQSESPASTTPPPSQGDSGVDAGTPTTPVPDAGTCVPTTCETAAAECGTIADGCGGAVECGACSEGSTCGGGGTPHRCGAPACTPKTCEALNATCGPVPDGCGGTVECGACPEGSTCGGGGIVHACGAPAPGPGSTRWIDVLGGPGTDSGSKVATAADGSTVVIGQYAGPGADLGGGSLDASGPGAFVARYGADGKLLWVRTWTGSDQRAWLVPWSLAISPLGNVVVGLYFLEGTMDFGDGVRAPGYVLLELDPSGALSWSRNTPHALIALATDADGRIATIGSSEIALYNGKGEQVWSRELVTGDPDQWYSLRAVTVTPSGEVVAAGNYRTMNNSNGALVKVGADGQLAFVKSVGWNAALETVATSANGTIFATGWAEDSISWGGTHAVNPGSEVTFLLTAEANGEEGSMRSWMGRRRDLQLAVDRDAGTVALGYSGLSCGTLTIERDQLDGTPLWTRAIEPSACDEDRIGLSGLAIRANHDVVAVGSLSGRYDFGTGQKTTQAQDLFLLDLMP